MFRHIQSLLAGSLRRAGIERPVQATHVLNIAHDALLHQCGEDVLELVRLRYVRGDCLFVSSSSSVVAQEVRLQEAEIVAFINQRVDAQNRIQGIRFIV